MTTVYKPGDRVVCLNQRSCHHGRNGTVIEPPEQHHMLSSIAGAPIVAVVEWDKFKEHHGSEVTTFTNPKNLAHEEELAWEVLEDLAAIEEETPNLSAEKMIDRLISEKELGA